MSATASPPTVAGATVVDDLFCVGCDYNLRTRPIDGPCPECGRPVIETLNFPRLSRSAPRWLSSLVDSVTLLLIAFALDMAIIRLRLRSDFLALALATIPWSLAWFAVWLLTRPEPGATARAASSRGAGRGRAWALRVLASGPYVAFVLALNPTLLPGFGRRYFEIVLVGLLLAVAPAAFLYYDHLRRAAERLPAPALATQARYLRWLVPSAALLSIAVLVWGTAGRGLAHTLHYLPKPVISGSADPSLLIDVLIAGTDPTSPTIVARMLGALAALAGVAVLIQFRLAFARAVRAASRPRAD